MHTSRIREGNVVLLTLLGIVPFAQAALQENQVLLKCNSRNNESLAIRNAYLAVHPGVVEYDLNLDYPTVPPDTRRDEPPAGGINNQYIAPETFLALFHDAQSDFQVFLRQQNPDMGTDT